MDGMGRDIWRGVVNGLFLLALTLGGGFGVWMLVKEVLTK